MADWPWPAGSYVRCVGSDGLPARRTCINHIFITFTDPQPVDYGCGYLQAARCVVCGDVTPAIDADFWRIRATQGDVVDCMGSVHEVIDWMQAHVMPELERAFAQQWNDEQGVTTASTLRDFG